MKALVVGATGVLGRQVVPRLLERGHTVRAVSTRPEAVDRLHRLGVDAFLADILDADSLREAARGCDVALHLATRVPRPGSASRDFTLNDRIRREGTANLIAVAREAGVRRYVQQSISFIYGDHGDDWIDEDAAVTAPASSAVVVMENQVRDSGLDWCILRGASFYGPSTGRDEAWATAAREGSLVIPGDGTAFTSLIQEVDAARAFVVAAESAPAASLYHVVDDEPVTYRDLYEHVAAVHDGPRPATGGPPVAASQRVSNRRLKDAVGWQPLFPTYRSGIA